MTAPPPSDGRAIPPSGLNGGIPHEPFLAAPSNTYYPSSRESSATRGRALSATSPRNASPRGVTPAAQTRQNRSGEVERKPSQSYGHHRQTSIVHGVQHSRNASLMSSTNGSPLSPHKIMTSVGPSSGTDAIHSAPVGLRKSPSASALHNETVSATTPRHTNRNFESHRPERMRSGKVKRGHDHQRGPSLGQNQSELKTVGEYALHHLFTSFIAEADERIERCMPRPGEPEPRVENICGPGADPAFDQLISSLGHINRHKPKSLIDAVIHWRKRKADRAHDLMGNLETVRNSVQLSQRTVASAYPPTSPVAEIDDLGLLERDVGVADRRSRISIYILCRVLIEIIGQTTIKALEGPDNTAARLEDIIYEQLKSADPDHIAISALSHACWVIRAQLLGVMSRIRFEEVSDKFIKDLEKAQKKLSIKGMADPKLTAKTSRLVYSMRWLKVRSSPDDAWEHSCDMLQLLAKFFAEVHGRVMKHAYAELFEQLLLPVAATATSELNLAKWKEVLALVQPKISQMLTKADHWPYVFPLQAVLLCVSPAEQFAREWLPLVVSSQPKAKDRSSRSHALKALCRLVWRYLYRLNDSQNAVTKKLDEVVRQVFQGGKRLLVSTDPTIADPLIQLIRIIGYKHQDICFRTIIFPLMNSELFSGPDHQLKIENLDPEKTVIAIRAFLAVMSDLEKGEPPSFPISFECDALMDPSSRSPITHRRTRSQGFSVSAGRTERLSRPVMLSNLNEVSRDYYLKFCKILGQLTIICDNTFGGQAALDEKFTSHTPKTPMAEAFTFNKREDMTTPTDLRQQYYDLLHVAVEALPRCVSRDSPINSLVNLLCVGTAHVQSHIASSSGQSLKAIARQGYAQQVTIGFARFIFNFDDRYATVSDGSLLGPGHIEGTLALYVELLQIWIDDIQRRARKTAGEATKDDEKAARPLDLTTVLVYVDEIESHGLFFLCSPSRAVRAIAVNVLHLVTKFDTALGKPSTRIISILEGSAEAVIDVQDDHFAPAERGRLQKGSRKSGLSSILIELCSSDLNQDATLWFKIFPSLVRLSSQICLHTVALTRELVCQRLLNTHKTIAALSDSSRQGSVSQQEPGFLSVRPVGRLNVTSPDIVIEQWKIHLIFACTTLTNIGSAPGNAPAPKSSQSSQHTRKSSKSSSTSHEKIASATELFSRVVPCLASPNPAVRRAAVMGLGATNATLYHALLEALHPYVIACSSEAKDRLGTHQRTVSSPRRSPRTDYMRVDITHLLSLTCQLLHDEMAPGDTYALEYLVDYTKSLRIFLSDAEVHIDLTLIKLKTHFCTLLEGLYDYTRKLKDSSRWMSFQSRQASFALMEDWCVRTTDESQIRRQDEFMRRAMMDRDDGRFRGNPPSSFRKDIHELSNAALSAMASLCAGPLILVAQDSIVMQFDVRRLLAWIDYIFDQQSDRIHAIGRRALENLITYNLDQPFIMTQAMRRCYLAKTPKALASCFDVVTKVLIDNTMVQTPFWKILCVGLYTLGNEDSAIRMKSARLLRTLEERQGKTSKLQDLDISVSDKTTAVYKLAQFEVSQRLAKQHTELAFCVFSEFSAYFNELGPDHQRNMVSAMLPWIQTIELQLDQSGHPTANTYMLLVNMFEITVRSSIHLHNEIQALWQALATGPYGGNVQLIVEFVKQLCLDRKEANFVIYAKQIVVFVSKTPAGASVVDHLLQQITPRSTAAPAEGHRGIVQPPDTAALPYVADIAHVLPSGEKQARLSCSTLSMILLVDLVVSPFNLSADRVQLLLGTVLFLWDFPTMIVQDQARELLVHLMHELIISKIEPDSTEPSKQSVEDFIEAIRKNDPKVTWTLADCDALAGDAGGRTVPDAMMSVVDQVINVFSIQYPTIREDLASMAIIWGTACPVRGVACGALRIFRCTSTTANAYTLGDIMLRLSNTIADDNGDGFAVFTLEILTTLKAQIDRVTPLDLMDYPQFFWVTCACLDTVHEKEFQQGMSMLELLLSKMDLSDPAFVKILVDRRTDLWQGDFDGLCALIYKGVRSSQSMCRSLEILEKLIRMPSNALVGGEGRLLYTTLANLPRYLHYFDDHGNDVACLDSAEALALAAESQNHVNLGRVLRSFAHGKYRSEKDFLAQCIAAVRTSFFPLYEFSSLVFLLGMVNNQLAWVKIKTMQMLSTILAEVDMRKPEIASQGPDLISPLLRLLQTEHCQQALDVLDHVIDMTGTPLDQKHLRMSMAGSHSSRATRKVYDSTKSLYGIPEESGWSIPMPAIHSRQSQHNTYETARTLLPEEEDSSTPAASTPEVEFVDEDQDSYFGDYSVILTPDDPPPDVNMGDLAMKLDSLDDFFDEQPEPASAPDRSGLARYPSGLVEERENLYNEQALPILHRSLQRNTSVTSFQTGFAELRYPNAREPAVMNPGAFATKTSAPVRPGLHNRSITTPAEVMTIKRTAPQLSNDIASGDEAGDEPEPFSDDELFAIGRAQTTEQAHFGQSAGKPAGFKAGFRSGLRRLASTSGNRDANKIAQAKSPRVPKVPQQYLREQ